MGMTIAQSVIDEGRVHHARTVLLRLAAKRFGTPDTTMRQAVEGITDLERLDRMTDRIDEATSWADLLSTS